MKCEVRSMKYEIFRIQKEFDYIVLYTKHVIWGGEVYLYNIREGRMSVI
jgi:hypothetical protein